MFKSLDDFDGYKFKMSILPWAHYVIADYISDEDGGTPGKRYENHWGYEMELVWQLQKILNFTFDSVNPVDQEWGLIR